jgi:UDP-2,3-diacylglucosamine hydrolase
MPSDPPELGRREAAPVAVLAGAGRLPTLIAEALATRGQPCRIAAVRGFADADTRRQAEASLDLLDVRGMLDLLDRWRPAAVLLAGTVHRPGPGAILSAFGAVRSRDELKRIIARGDDQLLRGVVGLLEEKGHRVGSLEEWAPELLAQPGRLGRRSPDGESVASIATGLRALADLSGYDVGQALVIVGQRIVAIEGPEGTDRLLARVRSFRRPWSRVRLKRGGVLVKALKRGQDRRVDLPAIGPRTVREAARAGLDGIAVASGTLIIDRPETAATADRLGLFVTVVEAP